MCLQHDFFSTADKQPNVDMRLENKLLRTKIYLSIQNQEEEH